MKRILLALAIAASVGTPEQPHAQSELALGVVLDHLASKLGGLVNTARDAGLALEVGAGGQLMTAIAAAKTAYADSLDVTTDRLTSQQKKVMDDLTTEIGYIEEHVLDKLQRVVHDGAAAINVLPLSKTFPQVTRYSPSLLAPTTSNALLRLDGNFFDAARDGYAPTLLVHGKEYLPVARTTAYATFSVPEAELRFGASLQLLQAKLRVPYRERFLLVFHRKQLAEFDVLLATLPPSSGTITFRTTKNVPGIERQVREGVPHQLVQESTDDDIPEPIANGRQVCVPATPGWTIEPDSVQMIVDWSEGDWSNFGNSSNIANACFNVATRHHRFGTSGKVHWHYRYTERRDIQVPENTATSEQISWNTTRVYRIPNGGSWTATWTQFDGKVFDIAGPSFPNPYLRVTTAGDTVTFSMIL